MDPPSELSLAEIRLFMIRNGCRVTNHALVKHFKKFLTNPENQNEARKQFKTYVNILATIKNENNEKFLILRKKYLHECPSEDLVNRTDVASSPGAQSMFSVGDGSPYRQPPPYKPPPEVTSPCSSNVKLPMLEPETRNNYQGCISEFQSAVSKIDSNRLYSESQQLTAPEICPEDSGPPAVPPRKRMSGERSVSRDNSIDENKENVGAATSEILTKNVKHNSDKNSASDAENPISVKEATKKFNRMASEEEAKIISPTSKKKPEKTIAEDKMSTEVTLSHPKSKEWIVAAAKGNYQELAKLASDNPELVKLQDPTTTALHWAAKHGKEDVVKLVAGKYKADVNARTNGGYTPLHLAMQFGKDNIFELLCNTYKANRDLLDWSGNKPLDYRKQRTTVSASTYSKIKARKKNSEKDLGFLRIGSLNVRVKKTTEAFSNFLGVGGGNTNQNSTNHHHAPYRGTTTTIANPNRLQAHMRTSAPPASKCFDKLHKTWGSADNIKHDEENMPPPKYGTKKNHSKRTTNIVSSGSNSMPTTPNQMRAPIGILSDNTTGKTLDSDSDSACGFDQNWSGTRTNTDSSSEKQKPHHINKT